MPYTEPHGFGAGLLRRWSGTLRAALLSGALAAATLSGSASAQTPGPITLEATGSFFVGGQDTQSDWLSPTPGAPGGAWTANQMYVQYQRPYGASHLPMVLIHGCCLTGKTWETTPDGRMGWYEYFVRRGFPTFVIDQAARGRSGFNTPSINEVAQGKADASQLPPISFTSHESAWTIFRFGLQFPDAFPGQQFPMWTAAPEGEFWKQMVPDLNRSLPQPTPTVAALSQLSISLAGAVLVSHSQSGIFPFQAAGISTQGIAGIIAVEPGACTNLDVNAVAKVPTLILFGDYVSQFANWSNNLQACTDFATQVKAAGGNIQVLQLPSINIFGNSHMLMQDRNNLVIADLLVQWVQDNVEKVQH